MAIELETKFAVDSLEEIRGRLRAMSAEVTGPHFERNVLFDTPERTLRSAGEILRLRQTDKVTITHKKPQSPPIPQGLKAMEELETLAGDFETMRQILHQLGFQEILWYEKCRETWRCGQALVCLDILPFGRFVEIEADAAQIAGTAHCLGLDMAQAQALSYHDLFRLHLAKLGLPPADSFIFKPKERAELLALCGHNGSVS